MPHVLKQQCRLPLCFAPLPESSVKVLSAAATLAGRSGVGVAGVRRELCLPRCSLLGCCLGLVGQTGQLRLLAAAGYESRESGSCACLAAVCLLAALVLSDRPGICACWPQRSRSRGSQEGAALPSLQFACLLLGSCRTDRATTLAGRSGVRVAGVRRELGSPHCSLRACCFDLVGHTGQQRCSSHHASARCCRRAL